MAETRVPRAATAEKRKRLLDAAERIMARDGYAAVTSRRVEAEALRSSEPLRAWWDVASDRRGNALLVEMTAAVNHRPAVQGLGFAMAHDPVAGFDTSGNSPSTFSIGSVCR